MTRYADSSLCPDCSTALSGSPAACPSCRLPLHHPRAAELFATLSRADLLLAELRRLADPLSTAPLPPSLLPEPPSSAPPPQRSGLRPTSVPAILLALGATCLLVAAVIFLAVAWSWLGVGGRTGVLMGLTAAGAGLGGWLTTRGLRVAGEALSTVTFGLLTLDLVGADSAGWLGEPRPSELGLVVCLALLGVALSWSAAQRRLAAPQVVAGLGLLGAFAAAYDLVDHPLLLSTAAVVAFGGLAGIGRARRMPLLPWVALLGAAPCWLTLAASGLEQSLAEPTLAALWSAGGPGWGLLAAAALLLLPVLVSRDAHQVRVLCVAAAVALGTLAVSLPVVDEGLTLISWTAVGVVLAGVAAGAAAPRRWLPVPLLSAGLAAMPVVVVTVHLVTQAAVHVVIVGSPFTSPAGVRVDPTPAVAHPAVIVPSAVALLALAWLLVAPGRPGRPGPPGPPGRPGTALPPATALLGVAAVATLAHYPVPLWSVVTALLALGLAAAVLGRDLALGGALLGAASLAALPSEILTASATGVLVLTSAVALRAAASPSARAGAAVVLPVAVAALLWSLAEVVGIGVAERGVPVAVIVGLLAISLHRTHLEVSAAAVAYLASVVAVSGARDLSVSLAVHLTVLGALASLAALLHRDRRWVAWPGGFLLAAATWVRLADIGVEAPEAYTLPTAVALLLVGLDRMRREPSTPTATALSPGLLLATTPSLLWVLDDPVSARAVLLGGACLCLVLAGSQLRGSAPLTIGAAVGGLLVLREVAPYAAQTPQWVMIGLAGALLTAVGVTWERRLFELRQATAYLDRLR